MARRQEPHVVNVKVGTNPTTWEAYSKIVGDSKTIILYRNVATGATAALANTIHPPTVYTIAAGFSDPLLTEWGTLITEGFEAPTIAEARILASAP